MEHDVFISHASEDKVPFVRDLAASLREMGLSVWYDDFALSLGDSLSDSIGKGLVSSSFGVIIISPHFIAKKWPRRELAALIAREDDGQKVILPIWHGVTKRDLLDHLPLLADKLAANSSDGVEVVAAKILRVVSPGRAAEKKYQQGRASEVEGNLDGARFQYLEALRIDPNHKLSLTQLVTLSGIQSSSLRKVQIILGNVKWFSQIKGFGFIETEDGQEYFIHISTLELHGLSTLSAGSRVAFLTSSEEKGKARSAVSVRLISFHKEQVVK